MALLPETPEERVIALITRHQVALYSFILPLLPNRALADDVLQETNLVIWRKAAEYDPSRPFMPWACGIARYQVMAARRDAARDRCVFDPDLIELLAAEDEPDLESTDAMNHALRDCLGELPEDIQKVSYPKLKERLLADGQILIPPPPKPKEEKKLPGQQ